MEIIEGNKIIAEFMGYTFFKSAFGGWGLAKEETDMSTWMELKDDQYHSDWSWLMPVVEKIEGLGQKCEIGVTSCTFYSGKYNVERTYAETKIKAVWLAVIQFIQWHNEQQQPK